MPLRKTTKTLKVHKDHPLTYRKADGRWMKKVRGNFVYFRGTADEVLAEWNKEKDHILLTGERPRLPADNRPTLEYLCNSFLHSRKLKMDAGDLSPQTWLDYQRAVTTILDKGFGRLIDPENLKPAHFTAFKAKLIGEGYSLHHWSKMVNITRTILNHAKQSGLISAIPEYGPDFTLASQKAKRRHKREGEQKIYSREQIVELLKHADAVMTAAILLGVNCGFGNHDVATVPLSAFDLDGGWVTFPRVKTEVDRRCPLWPETVTAMKAVIRERPQPKPGCEKLAFLNEAGGPMLILNETTGKRTDLIINRFVRLKAAAGINTKGAGFYWLRHVCQTIGDQSGEAVAVKCIMGHVDASMSGQYREFVADDNLRKVTDTVREWLFPKGRKGK